MSIRNTSNKTTEDQPNTEKFPSSRAEGDIGTREMVYRGLRQHSIVLQLRFSQRWAVTSNKNKLSYSYPVSTRDLLSLMLQSPERESE